MRMKKKVFAIVGYHTMQNKKFPIEHKKSVTVEVPVSSKGKPNLKLMWSKAASAFRKTGLNKWKTLSHIENQKQ